MQKFLGYKSNWLTLYRDDGSLDDQTTVNGTVRTAFRMHPGSRSAGCVTFVNFSDFRKVRDKYINSDNGELPDGSNQSYYGTLTVE